MLTTVEWTRLLLGVPLCPSQPRNAIPNSSIFRIVGGADRQLCSVALNLSKRAQIALEIYAEAVTELAMAVPSQRENRSLNVENARVLYELRLTELSQHRAKHGCDSPLIDSELNRALNTSPPGD